MMTEQVNNISNRVMVRCIFLLCCMYRIELVYDSMVIYVTSILLNTSREGFLCMKKLSRVRLTSVTIRTLTFSNDDPRNA